MVCGLLVPQQLVDGIDITADTHPTFPLGAEVGIGESFGLSVGRWVDKLLHCAACLGQRVRPLVSSNPTVVRR